MRKVKIKSKRLIFVIVIVLIGSLFSGCENSEETGYAGPWYIYAGSSTRKLICNTAPPHNNDCYKIDNEVKYVRSFKDKKLMQEYMCSKEMEQTVKELFKDVQRTTAILVVACKSFDPADIDINVGSCRYD